ncbi:MAG: hypothetical protein MUO33_05935 [Sedimentisphaerales bacterium]|nr:hypothetical protein [Sedimentisphaerales bacterium]
MTDEFRKEYLPIWEECINELFPKGLPNSASWNNLTEIINVLNHIGRIPNNNHLFFPKSGGLDLTGAKLSNEDKCIELQFGTLCAVIKPHFLACEIFPSDLEWSYFRIETNKLSPSGVYDDLEGNYEEVVELEPCHYVDRSVWDEGRLGYDENGNDIPLPPNARPLMRYLQGSFVIFAKASIYNLTSSTYDGRHDKMSYDEFKRHIQEQVKSLKN